MKKILNSIGSDFKSLSSDYSCWPFFVFLAAAVVIQVSGCSERCDAQKFKVGDMVESRLDHRKGVIVRFYWSRPIVRFSTPTPTSQPYYQVEMSQEELIKL